MMCAMLFRETVSRAQLRDARAVVESLRTLNAFHGSFSMRNLFTFGNLMIEFDRETSLRIRTRILYLYDFLRDFYLRASLQ